MHEAHTQLAHFLFDLSQLNGYLDIQKPKTTKECTDNHSNLYRTLFEQTIFHKDFQAHSRNYILYKLVRDAMNKNEALVDFINNTTTEWWKFILWDDYQKNHKRK